MAHMLDDVKGLVSMLLKRAKYTIILQWFDKQLLFS